MKVLSCGVCGSDLRVWEKGISNRRGGPGHEVVGVLVKGPEALSPYLGKRLAVVATACGKCKWCLSGRENMCPERSYVGFSGPGGFSEYVAVPTATFERGGVLEVPDELDSETASLCEPLACVLCGQEKLSVGPGSSVAVIGGGPIGAMHAFISKLRGASKVFISDLHDERLRMLAWVSASKYINASRCDTVREVLDATAGEGVDVVIVCCSNPSAQSQAVYMARRTGTVLYFSGLPSGEGVVPIDVETVHRRELELVGSRNAGRRHFRLAMELLREHSDLGLLVSRGYSLENVNTAFMDAAAGRAMKAVVSIG